MSSRWWSTARSIRILTRRDEILYFSNFKSRNGSNMIFFRIHMDPLDHWSVKPHTTCLNFLSILTKQCTILNTTHWYLNIPLDQTHPFLKGFYYRVDPLTSHFEFTLQFQFSKAVYWPCIQMIALIFSDR